MFKCEECNVNLNVIIENGTYVSYSIKDDGSLEYLGSDGYGEELHLCCPECNEKYEFDNRLMTVIDVPKFSWFGRGKLDLTDINIRRKERSI